MPVMPVDSSGLYIVCANSSSPYQSMQMFCMVGIFAAHRCFKTTLACYNQNKNLPDCFALVSLCKLLASRTKTDAGSLLTDVLLLKYVLNFLKA